jgi:uncharacterized protein DUF3108
MKAALTAAIVALFAQTNVAFGQTELPFVVGERLHYRVSVGKLGTVGEGVMSVDGPVEIRGTQTLVLRSEMKAHVAFLKSYERAESWLDPTRMAILRYQKRGRGPLARGDERVEVYPEDLRWEDGRGNVGELPTDAPLDELSFIYYLRTLPLADDTVETVVRHYNRDRNPIAVRVIGRDTVRTRAGTFATIEVEMKVKDPKRYGGEGTIRIHLSDDAYRYPVRIESSVPVFGSTVLTLDGFTCPRHLATRP